MDKMCERCGEVMDDSNAEFYPGVCVSCAEPD